MMFFSFSPGKRNVRVKDVGELDVQVCNHGRC